MKYQELNHEHSRPEQSMHLEHVGLGVNQISDITPLTGMIQLELLRLHRNQITDITPLLGLRNLTLMYLGGNPLTLQTVDELRAALPNCEIPN